MMLGLVISLIVILCIHLFSESRLLTHDFQCWCIITVVLGTVSVAVIFSSGDIIGGTFAAGQTFFSILLLVYAMLVRRKVQRGRAQEMRKTIEERSAGRDDVELGSQKKVASVQEDPPPPYCSSSLEDVA